MSKNEVTGSNRSSKMVARYWEDLLDLVRPLGSDVGEISTVAVEHRLLAGEVLPALHRNIDVSRRDLNRVRNAAGHLGRDYRRARAAERFVDGLPGRRIILDRPAHALDPPPAPT